jgi:hypothetical protein
MKKFRKTVRFKVMLRMTIWALLVLAGVAYYLFTDTSQAFTAMFTENCHSKMLINYEYTRRVLSDVYVQVSNNVYQIENSLDNPNGQIAQMRRIVQQGNRIHSCGMNFVKGYYPQKGDRYCPFAWRNPKNREEILTDEKGDHDFDYLQERWFKAVVEGDTAEWSDPFYDGYDKTTALAAYMVPIHDKTGKAVAVLGADISLDWLTYKLNETDSTYNAQSRFASEIMGLKSQSYIIDYDGKFITHPDRENLLNRVFYDCVSQKDPNRRVLIQKMKSEEMSSNESSERYLFLGEESYFFYTPLKYTNWMMVTVVPCRSIDMLGIEQCLRVFAIVAVGLIILLLLVFYYFHD